MSKAISEKDQNRAPIYKHATFINIPMKAAESSLFYSELLVSLLCVCFISSALWQDYSDKNDIPVHEIRTACLFPALTV